MTTESRHPIQTHAVLHIGIAVLVLGATIVMSVSHSSESLNRVDQARNAMLIAFVIGANVSLGLAFFGRARAAMLFLVGLVWLGITAFVVFTGLGLHSSVLFLYLPAILFTALLCSATIATLHTFATIAVLWGLWWAEHTGRLRGLQTFMQQTTHFNFTVGVVAACLATLILALAFQATVRKAHEELASAHERTASVNEWLQMASRAARTYSWEWNIGDDRLTWLTPAGPLLGPIRTGEHYPEFKSMVHPEDREAYIARSRQIMASGDEYEHEFRIIRTDGVARWLHGRGKVFRDGPGKAVRIVGVTVDIDERKQREAALAEMSLHLERRVDERTADLAAALKELESISYSVSHDMRTPLRAIHAFAALVGKEANALSGDSRDLLTRIGSNASRMGLMVDALVALIRVTRSEPALEPLEMNQLAGAAVLALRPRYPLVHVNLGPMPPMHADREMVRELLLQLLDNALKFSAARHDAVVEIGWDAAMMAWFVRDNGIGIDAPYAHKIWGMFEQLNPPGAYPGVGVGLALAKRIVERHHGSTWTQSQLGAGSTFFFKVPRPDEAPLAAPGAASPD